MPIEKIRVGDRVLSKLENGEGEQVYKPVVNTFTYEDKEVFLVDFVVPDNEENEERPGCLVVTGNHPFWVQGVGWTRADNLEPGNILELHDGSMAIVNYCLRIFETAEKDVGWSTRRIDVPGRRIDLRNDEIVIGAEGAVFNSGELERGIDLKQKVYNIEVDGSHTYYVGELGVLVHNTNCSSNGTKP